MPPGSLFWGERSRPCKGCNGATAVGNPIRGSRSLAGLIAFCEAAGVGSEPQKSDREIAEMSIEPAVKFKEGT